VLEEVQKVTVKDVRRVAKKYLKPENLTVAIFGALTDEDRKALDERLVLHILKKEEVFTGGYADQPQPDAAPMEPSGRSAVN
jgi:predicted Zn-dependent peptidase